MNKFLFSIKTTRLLLPVLVISFFCGYSNAQINPSHYFADPIVYGGTYAAVTVAVEAVQSGKTVLFVSPDIHLGGLSFGGQGFTDIGNKSTIGVLSREFYHRVWLYYLEVVFCFL